MDMANFALVNSVIEHMIRGDGGITGGAENI